MTNQVQDHPSVKIIIPGVSGCGKTTLFEKLIRREKADWIFLFDHKDGDFARRFAVKSCRSLEELIEATERGGFVFYDPGAMFPGKPDEGFRFFAAFVWDMCRDLPGIKIFGGDELDWLIDPRNCPDEFLAILDQGRTFQINCFFIAQAMNALHNGVRKQFAEIFAFRQGDVNGVAWLASQGFDSEKLMNLRNGEWLYKNTITGNTASGGKAFVPKNSGRNLKGL